MELFLDTANIEEIKKARDWGVISGVTTNPSLVSKEGKTFRELILEICNIIDGPISAEAVGMDCQKIIQEARILSGWHKNIIIKIPIMPEGLSATRVLSKEGIKINTTLVFSVNQAILAANAGSTYVSPFMGRIDDISWDGVKLIEEIIQVFNKYNYKTKVIAASIRNPLHVVEIAKIGTHIATVPFKVIEQMIKHPLTDIGIEKFLKDWERIPSKLIV